MEGNRNGYDEGEEEEEGLGKEEWGRRRWGERNFGDSVRFGIFEAFALNIDWNLRWIFWKEKE